MLVSGKLMLKDARKGGYAIPALNTSNLEVSQALAEAAEESNSPLLIQTTESAINYAGLESLFSTVSILEKQVSVPVCIHLDHGKDLQLIKKCLSLGYKSVMIDASHYSFAKNIALTKMVVAFAKGKKASVEAELGTLGRKGKASFTDPNQAKEFVEKTGCDSLAVAIGTSHGAYKFEGNPKIDLSRLKEISEEVSIPLVLHGASSVPKALVNKANIFGASLKRTSGVSPKQLKKAVRFGVSKINIDTDLRLAFTAGLREHLAKHGNEFDPRKYLDAGREAVKHEALKKMKLFGSKGKAK